MPQIHYCWRCKQERPFFDEEEWRLLKPIATQRLHAIKVYRSRHQCSVSVATAAVDSLPKFRELPLLAGDPAANPTDLWHHRLATHGPPCKNCGKLLRTPRASRCVECGVAVAA